MIPDYAIRNFKTYMQTTPKSELGVVREASGRVRGAYDSRNGLRRRLRIGDFYPGGAFDSIMRDAEPAMNTSYVPGADNEGGPNGRGYKFLKMLASKLSSEDWAELHDVLTNNDDGETAQDDIPSFKRDGMPRNAAEPAMDEALRYAPGIGRITVGDGGW